MLLGSDKIEMYEEKSRLHINHTITIQILAYLHLLNYTNNKPVI